MYRIVYGMHVGKDFLERTPLTGIEVNNLQMAPCKPLNFMYIKEYNLSRKLNPIEWQSLQAIPKSKKELWLWTESSKEGKVTKKSFIITLSIKEVQVRLLLIFYITQLRMASSEFK